ncbi:MAG: mevalonate kinase [archaeon]
MITASAPAKVILFGEHSVVYDRKGIAGAVNLRTSAKIRANDEIKIVLEDYKKEKVLSEEDLFYTLKEVEKHRQNQDYAKIKALYFDEFAPIKIAVAKALETLNVRPFELRITSRIPVGGLGSSSSIAASAAGAVQFFHTGEINPEYAAKAANLGDVIAHGGTPSGIDASTVTFGGFIQFQKSKGPKPLEIKKILPVVIGNTGIQAKTAATVQHVRKLRERNPELVDWHLDEMNRIAEDAVKEVKRPNLKKLGELMNENQEHLRSLGVSHPKLEKLIKASIDAGAVGAKLSGGGGGGIMIALCANENDQRNVSEAIEKHGGVAMITQIGTCGLKVFE